MPRRLVNILDDARPTMATPKQKPKPKAWRKSEGPPACCACEQYFKRGDKIYDVGAMAIHSHCVKLYVQQMKELGLTP